MPYLRYQATGSSLANDIIIIKPMQYHRFNVKSENGCEFIVLNFTFENRINGEYAQIPMEDFLNFVSSREESPYIKLKVSPRNEIVVLLNRILKERRVRSPGANSSTTCYHGAVRAAFARTEDGVGKQHKAQKFQT